MDPVAFSVFGFTVAWYGILIVGLGFLLGGLIATRLGRARGLNVDLLGDMIFWTIIWGVVGARLFFVITSPGAFRGASFLDYINLRQGGISIHGCLVFGILVLAYYKWRYHLNFYRYAEVMIPAVGLGIIGGRIGNIMNGSDTVGRVTGWPVGFVWPSWARGFHDNVCNPNSAESLAQYCVRKAGQLVMPQPVHFTQLYGVIIGIIILALSFLWLRSRKPGWAFWQFWLWYSILRAGAEETFRLNPLTWKVYLSEGPNKAGIGLFTLTQLVSIPLILISIYFLLRLRNSPDVPFEPRPEPRLQGS